MRELAIREVAEQTGIAAGTIRMWEQRYGFPTPQRTPSGYRLYSEEDVETLRRVITLRNTGLSVSAALERARTAAPGGRPTDRPSIFGAVPHGGRTRRLRKKTLVALSRAIEDETLASAAGPIVLGAFQRAKHYEKVRHRYERMAKAADVAAVFADFGEDHAGAALADGEPVEIGIRTEDPMGHEWAVVVDAPGFSVCLVAWEPPVSRAPANDMDRIFETFWTLDPEAVRRATEAGAAVARTNAPEVSERITDLLAERPLGATASVTALEALAMRMVGYLESA
jgi:MerR family transcriptional regulator, light-induced transcriptional regulator